MKKLLLLPVLTCVLSTTMAQVYTAGSMFPVYVDIVPDSLMNYTVAPYTHETYDLNLFSDPAADIQFIAHGAVSSGGTGAYLSVTTLNPNLYVRLGRMDSVFSPANSSWVRTNVAKPLVLGEQINSMSAEWQTGQLYLTDHSGSGGANKDVNDFIGGDKYIGLKFMSGTVATYGWIRVQAPSEDSIYVKDFSVMGAVGVREIAKENISIYPNPAKTDFYLRGLDANSFDASKLKLKNIVGRDVKFTTENKNGLVKINLSPELPAGCYFIEYTSQENTISQKLIKISN